MKTLRQIMTNEVKSYGWLDFNFKQGDNNATAFKGDYAQWLNSLSDEDFLERYNDVREDYRNLD